MLDPVFALANEFDQTDAEASSPLWEAYLEDRENFKVSQVDPQIEVLCISSHRIITNWLRLSLDIWKFARCTKAQVMVSVLNRDILMLDIIIVFISSMIIPCCHVILMNDELRPWPRLLDWCWPMCPDWVVRNISMYDLKEEKPAKHEAYLHGSGYLHVHKQIGSFLHWAAIRTWTEVGR